MCWSVGSGPSRATKEGTRTGSGATSTRTAYGPAIFLSPKQGPGLKNRHFNNTVIQLHGPVAGFLGSYMYPDAQLCVGINVTGTRMYNLLGVGGQVPY